MSYRPPESVLWLMLMIAINDPSFRGRGINPEFPMPVGCPVTGAGTSRLGAMLQREQALCFIADRRQHCAPQLI